MGDTIPVITSLSSLFLIHKEQSPQTKEERELMAMIPYASTIESLMYAMVYMRPNIGHAVGLVNKFMSNLSKSSLGSG
jgi:hypothetical protein